VGADAVLAGAFGNRAAQIRLPRPSEPMKDNVLLPGDERAGAELGKQLPVEAALVEQVDAPQVRVRVTQRHTPDQASNQASDRDCCRFG